MHSLNNSNGWVLWEGLSNIDGFPIVLLMTGIYRWSSNPKTGFMYQTWILRSDMHPQDALKLGLDFSICGTCKARKDPITNKRICYVNPITIGQVYKQYRDNKYEVVKLSSLPRLPLGVRIGSYGDPGAVPLNVWQALLTKVPYHTGYTQLWRSPQYQDYKSILMASCFSPDDYLEAKKKGWRTYRVKSPNQHKLKDELLCPASKDIINPKTCQMCKLCKGGNKGIDIVIDVHGVNSKYFA